MKENFYNKTGFLLICLVTISTFLHAQYWESVGPEGFSAGVSANNQLAISPQGTIYVAYEDGELDLSATVKVFDGTNWVSLGEEGFTNGWVQGVSLAIDPSGTPLVAFADRLTTWKASVMYWNGAEWDYLGSPEFSADTADYTDMAIDRVGTPYVVYRDFGNGEKCTVRKYDGTNWVDVGSPGFSSTVAVYLSIAIDTSGVPFVSFQDVGYFNRITVMKFNGSNWEYVGSPGFSTGAALYTCMSIDQNNVPHVAFRDNGLSGKARVMKFNGTNWVNLGTPGLTIYPARETLLDFTPDNVPVLAYRNGDHIGSQIAVERYRNNAWEIMGSVGISQHQADFLSMDIDSVGIPYLVYRDAFNFNTATVKKYVPATFYVDASMPDDSQNGISWTWAKKTLQAALDLVENGGQIWVKKGVYTPTSTWDIPDATSRNKHFRMKKHVKIIGGLAGTEGYFSNLDLRDYVINETVLSGDIGVENDPVDNCYHVLYHPEGLNLSTTAILDGFTITKGNADGSDEQGMGGGVYNLKNSPLFKNCVFKENTATIDGGGVFIQNSATQFINCIVTDNIGSDGAGMGITGNSSVSITNSLIFSNTSSTGSAGLRINESEVLLVNTTVANNQGGTAGGIGLYENAAMTLNNSIVWGNNSTGTAHQFLLNQSSATLNYSCYSNQANDVSIDGLSTLTTGYFNLTTDPKFVDAAIGDFRLYGSSPCVETGFNNYNTQSKDLRMKDRIFGSVIDRGPYEWNEGFDPSLIFYVDNNRPDDSGNGLTWATAKKTIQAAISGAASSDQVWVKSGTYFPTMENGGTGNRYLSFQLKEGVAVYGGFNGDETTVSQRNYQTQPTVLTGDLNGDDGEDFINRTDNCYHIFYLPSQLALTSKTVLDGFILKGGNADGAGEESHGAAFYSNGNQPTLKNLRVYDHFALENGAGFYLNNSSPKLENCFITENSADAGTAVWYGQNSNPIITNCLIADNQAATGAAGVECHGSAGEMINTTIVRNQSLGNGGGMALLDGSFAYLKNSIVYLNKAASGKQFYLNQASKAVLFFTCYANLENDVVKDTESEFLPGAGSNTVNPKFVDVAGKDYRLAGNSSLLDAGDDSYNYTTYDIRGPGYQRKMEKTSSNNGRIDFGAFEYQVGTDYPNWIMYVNMVASGDNNGYTWADAFNSLQPALSIANANDHIWIAPGIYKPSATAGGSGDRFKSFQLKNNVTILGGFAGDESIYYDVTLRNLAENETILTGDLNGDDNYEVTPWTGTDENCYHVFRHNAPLTLNQTAILDGVTIRGGNASAWGDHFGPGMQNINNNSPSIRNVVFTNNKTVGNGGGMYNYVSSSPVMEGCTFTKNIAQSYGSGIFNSGYSNPVIKNCAFSFNSGSYLGGGICNYDNASSLIENCEFYNNSSTYFGGGVYYGVNCPISITSSIISHNSSEGDGGGIYSYQDVGFITNSLIANNTAINRGGGIFNYQSSPVVTNTTIVNNTVNYAGGGVFSYSQSSQSVFNNSIIWGNNALQFGKQFYIEAATVTMNHSCYSNEANDVVLSNPSYFNISNNNITLNPAFVWQAAEDYRILGTSPCINTGNNSYNTLTTDIRGNTRIQDTSIDMGAYEFSSGYDPGIPLHFVDLPAGWSGFSSYVIPLNPAIETVLQPIVDKLIIAKTFTTVYWPEKGVNTIGNFDYHQGYYCKLEEPTTLPIEGSSFGNKTVELTAGWNLLPVLSDQPVNTATFAALLGDNLIIISEISGSQVYWPGAGIFSLETLQPGRAYHIKVVASGQVTFP